MFCVTVGPSWLKGSESTFIDLLTRYPTSVPSNRKERKKESNCSVIK